MKKQVFFSMILLTLLITLGAASMARAETLTVWFSCTGNTETIAQTAAATLNADLWQIVPEEPYTEEDLNYHNDQCRANREQNDPDCRPAIAGDMALDDYDTILLAYPIWWGQAPRIISTFLDHYDFEGKTIVPFCTSGSNGIGASATDLHGLAPSTSWISGRRFSGTVTASELAEWVSELSLPEGAVSAKAA